MTQEESLFKDMIKKRKRKMMREKTRLLSFKRTKKVW